MSQCQIVSELNCSICDANTSHNFSLVLITALLEIHWGIISMCQVCVEGE